MAKSITLTEREAKVIAAALRVCSVTGGSSETHRLVLKIEEDFPPPTEPHYELEQRFTKIVLEELWEQYQGELEDPNADSIYTVSFGEVVDHFFPKQYRVTDYLFECVMDLRQIEGVFTSEMQEEAFRQIASRHEKVTKRKGKWVTDSEIVVPEVYVEEGVPEKCVPCGPRKGGV